MIILQLGERSADHGESSAQERNDPRLQQCGLIAKNEMLAANSLKSSFPEAALNAFLPSITKLDNP